MHWNKAEFKCEGDLGWASARNGLAALEIAERIKERCWNSIA